MTVHHASPRPAFSAVEDFLGADETKSVPPDIRDMSTSPDESFHDLWVRYAGEIYRFALYLSGERAMAEDVTAEASEYPRC